jgi:peptidoglycan/LPS O-acetylase OafA/YrhL
LLGLPAGWLWNFLADSPEGVVFDGVPYFDETQLNIKSEMTLWYLAVGVVLGVVAGLVVALRGYRHGVTTVAAVLVLGAAAAAVTALTGIHLFGPDEGAQVAAVEEGGEISAGLAIDSWVAYLGWPAGALIGALAAVAGWPHDGPDRPAPPPPPPPPRQSGESANS